METSRSPARMPAATAGVCGLPSHDVVAPASVAGTTHCETEATTAPGCGVDTPWTVTRIVRRATPMSRFMVGPPSMTRTFFGTDNR